MTREEAIEYNKNLREYMRITDKKSEYKFLKENYEALEMAIQALEQEPKWIPVTERLPDKDGLYLVSVKNDHERRYSKTCWYSDKNWFARQDVVAWMPLPKPYKGGQEE